MKRGCPDHWKMRELARLLKIPKRYALPCANGIMERLWHYTAKYALQGDIGRVPDTHIADACGWPIDDALRLIDALVEAHWLDRDETHRLLVHDWHEHADESTKKTLKNRGLQFIFLERFHPASQNFPASLSLASPEPLPEPKPEPIAAKPPPSESLTPIWDWFRQSYPETIASTMANVRRFESKINTPERISALQEHLPEWIQTRKFREGFAGKWQNFLDSEVWLYAPKASELQNGTRKSKAQEALDSL